MFTSPRGTAYNPHIHLPISGWHAVLTFTPSLHISGYVCDVPTYSHYLRTIDEHQRIAAGINSHLDRRTLTYEIQRGHRTWSNYICTEPDAQAMIGET